MAARLIELNARRDEIKGQLLQLADAATKDKRPLTDAERDTSTKLQEELELVVATTQLEEKRLAWERESAPPKPAADPPKGATPKEGPSPWASFGEFLVAVANVSLKGEIDPRLQAGPSGMNSSVPSEGGFLVRQEYSTLLLNKAMQDTVLAKDCTEIPIGDGFDGLELPYIDETSRANGSRWGGVQVFRRAEADTVTATKPKLGKLELRLEDLMALCYLTGRGTQDAMALESIIENAFRSEFAFKVDDEIVRGTGAGQCLGLFPGGVLGAATVQQAKEGGQAVDTVNAANVQKMFARTPSRNTVKASWYINQEVWPQLFGMNQANMPVFMPGITLSNAPFGMLLGRPIKAVEQLPGLGDLGDIVFADMSEYLLITKGGLQAAQSMHVRFLYDEMTFRFIYRINGAPAWKTTLTPYKATAATALSPFVGLEAR